MNDEHRRPFADALADLTTASGHNPQAIRLAAVVSALMEVASGDKEASMSMDDTMNNDATTVSASKVYASTVTALEGTLQQEDDAASLATQAALLQVLVVTVPYVEPTTLLQATLPLTSRVLRAVVASVQQSTSTDSSSRSASDTATVRTKKSSATTHENSGTAGATSVLRWACKASTRLLLRLAITPSTSKQDKALKQFLKGTLLTLFSDTRPKVRKAAHQGVLEALLAVSKSTTTKNNVVVETVTSYAHQQLSQALAQATTAASQELYADLLHLLTFLKSSISYLTVAVLGADVMELLGALARLGTAASADHHFVATTTKVKESTPRILVIQGLLSTVLALLEGGEEGGSLSRKEDELDEFAVRVLATLLQLQPTLVFRAGAAPAELLQKGRALYGQVVVQACRRVMESSKKADLACRFLPLTVQMILLLCRPSEEEDDPSETEAFSQLLMVELVQLFRMQLPVLISKNPPGLVKALNETQTYLKLVLRPTYAATWSVSLNSWVSWVEQVVNVREDDEEEIVSASNVQELLDLHSKVPAGSTSQSHVEAAVSTLIQAVGMDTFWKWIEWSSTQDDLDPLNVRGPSIHKDQVWILSMLKSAGMAAQPRPLQFTFFQRFVLEKARACDKLAASAPASSAERRFERANVVRLWALFPCFCQNPPDLLATMPSLTSTLARALEDKRYPQLVTIICTGITRLITSIPEVDGESREVMSSASVKLLPVLLKLVTSPEAEQDKNAISSSERSQRVKSVTDAVSAMALIVPGSFLSGLFKKLMRFLLDEIQTEDNDGEKISSLLILFEALVSSAVLDESTVLFLYRAIKSLIMNDQFGHRVQKRSYRVLAEICEQHHSFATEPERLAEMTELLTQTIMTSQVAARPMRLKCMNIIVEALRETKSAHLSTVFDALPEILLCLKDPNAKTREAAYQLLLSMASCDDTTSFLQRLTAALGAETAHMRSAAVMALSRIVFEMGWQNEGLQPLLPSLLRTVIVLIEEDSREVVKSVIGMIRISVAAIPVDQLEALLPDLVLCLTKYHKTKGRFRAKIKIILKKLVRLYDYETVMRYVPESETKLLTHMRKVEERQIRRKAAARAEKLANGEEYDSDADLDDDDDDSDDDGTLMSGTTAFTRMTGKTIKTSKRSHTRRTSRVSTTSRPSKEAIRLRDDKDGEVVDLLASNPSHYRDIGDDEMDDDSSDDGVMEFDDDGLLVVRDEGEKKQSASNEFMSMPPNKKRRTSKADEQSRQGAKNKQRSGRNTPGLGSSYKSKKAGGDVRKKGQKFEPYAYVPLDGRNYSKKNRQNTVDKMASVVRKGRKRQRS